MRKTSEDVNVDIQVFIMKTTEAKNSDKEQTHWREINRWPFVCENNASTIALSCPKTNEIPIITNKECLDYHYLWSDRRGYQGSDCYRVSRARSPGYCTAGNLHHHHNCPGIEHLLGEVGILATRFLNHRIPEVTSLLTDNHQFLPFTLLTLLTWFTLLYHSNSFTTLLKQ